MSLVWFISSLAETRRTAFLLLWVCEIVAGHNVEYRGGAVGGFALVFFTECAGILCVRWFSTILWAVICFLYPRTLGSLLYIPVRGICLYCLTIT